MITFLRVIQLLFPALLVIAPFFFYKKKYRWLMRFYCYMTFDDVWRKAYMLALVVLLGTFNFAYFYTEGASLWLAPSFIVCCVLLRYSFTHATLLWLHSDRMLQGLAFAAVLITMILPQLYTLSLTFAFVLMAAMFYPSRMVLKMASEPCEYAEFNGTEEDVYRYYF